jgi:hypothetical protein
VVIGMSIFYLGDITEVLMGLGRIVVLHHCSFTLYRNR